MPDKSVPATDRATPAFSLRIVVLCLLTLAGACLRLYHIGGRSLWLDESLTALLARMPWPQFSETWWHGDATYQTLYYLLMRLWSPSVHSETWLRLPSAVFGIASIPLMYVVARKVMDIVPALAAAALLTFSATHVYYSQEARSYTLTIFLVLLSFLFFIRAVEERRGSDWLLWTIFGTLAVYSHYFAAFVLVAQACSLFFHKKPAPWRAVVLLGLVIFAAAIPGLSYVLRVPSQHLQYSWMPKATPKEILHVAMFLGGTHLRFALVLVLWIAAVVSIIRSGKERTSGAFWNGMLILLWAVLPVAIMALISVGHPIFVHRYMIFSLPAVLMLAALGEANLKKWHIGLLAVIVLCASSLGAIFKEYHAPREDWRDASNVILSSAHDGDAILFLPDYMSMPFDYYRERYPQLIAFQTFPVPTESNDATTSTLISALKGQPPPFHHVWIVLTGNGVRDTGLQQASPALADSLGTLFGPPIIHRFKDITVLQFGR